VQLLLNDSLFYVPLEFNYGYVETGEDNDDDIDTWPPFQDPEGSFVSHITDLVWDGHAFDFSSLSTLGGRRVAFVQLARFRRNLNPGG